MQYNIKLRVEKEGKHISGAEKIVDYANIEKAVICLLERTRLRFETLPDMINLNIIAIKDEIMYVKLPKRSRADDGDIYVAREKLHSLLIKLNLNADYILDLFNSLQGMRGAVLLDIDTYERLEPDMKRGVRVTCFDYAQENYDCEKNHSREAKCLAAKVMAYPNIVGEICVTDDKDFTFGYFATRDLGIIGFNNLKKLGEKRGGRIFLFDSKIGIGSKENKISDCIKFLENAPVLVEV